jgi:hypothetical protein
MLLASLPSTRLSATASLVGCTKRTAFCAPIEKLCQSATMRALSCLTTMLLPLTLTFPAP